MKKILTIILALLITGVLSFSAFAATPKKTVTPIKKSTKNSMIMDEKTMNHTEGSSEHKTMTTKKKIPSKNKSGILPKGRF